MVSVIAWRLVVQFLFAYDLFFYQEQRRYYPEQNHIPAPPKLPFKTPQIPSNRDHKSTTRGTVKGLGRSLQALVWRVGANLWTIWGHSRLLLSKIATWTPTVRRIKDPMWYIVFYIGTWTPQLCKIIAFFFGPWVNILWCPCKAS